MTITESELREILAGDGGGGEDHRKGVAVVDVHRRVRAIRRRRWGTAGAAAAALTVAVALNVLPGGDTANGADVWTGVMARPSAVPPTVSQPLGEPYPVREVMTRSFGTGGAREELRLGSGSGSMTVTVHCSGPLRRAVVWIDDGPPRRQLCGTGPDGFPLAIFQEDRSATTIKKRESPAAGGRVVSAAVLPGEIDSTGKTMNMLLEGMDEHFEGWEAQLAEAKPFPLKWSVSVREVIFPVCRDNVRQVDPRTGEMVLLRCEGEATAPPNPS
ncbi:hypothetical protein [Streptosporangium amethystogenes]|uniref:hypothetical protein n=1 Tax=Streptosporangium amethystogenes TaxID=2002 RepID=UPI0004C5F9A4|nr:hypothetical protein [Streptosporangium amethystogenes]